MSVWPSYIKTFRPFDLIIILVWISNPLITYAKIVMSHMPILHQFVDVIMPIIYISLIILSLGFLKTTIHFVDIMIYMLVAAIYLLHYICFPQNQAYLQQYLFSFFITVLPVYFVGVSMHDIIKIKPVLEVLSYIAILCYFIFRTIIAVEGDRSVAGGDMFGAYSLLPFLLFTTWCNFERYFNVLKLITLFSSLFVLLLLGNRGSMLCYIIFVALYFLSNSGRTIKSWMWLIGIVCMIIFLLFFNEIVLSLAYITEQLGFSLRIFEKIMDGEILDSSGRDALLSTAADAIFQKPFLGYGITGDRVILGGIYVHNIFLEILLAFGLSGGIILILAIFLIVIKAYRQTADRDLRAILLIFVSCGLFPLFLSSTYLDWPKFFLLLGFSVYLAFRR